jgi:hypothetical protein
MDHAAAVILADAFRALGHEPGKTVATDPRVGEPVGQPACRPLRISPFFPGRGDAARVQYAGSFESGEVPDNEVNTHRGDPG